MDDTGAVLNVIEIVSDVIWAIDIVVTFFSAYEDKEDNLIVSRKVFFQKKKPTLILRVENSFQLHYRVVFARFCVNTAI